ncbi:MAG: hypothetical protein HY908_09755 [Myxococcales bacterium]|nr:hypothetical protein [Myxococcales bacterium]
MGHATRRHANLVQELCLAIVETAAAGDLDAARSAHVALGALLNGRLPRP